MRAHVYIVEVNGKWLANLTISSAVDRHFWMDGDFGEGGRLNTAIAESGWLWQEALPLGVACMVVELWEEHLKKDDSDIGTNHSKSELNEATKKRRPIEALNKLYKYVEAAKREADAGAGDKKGELWEKLFGRWRKQNDGFAELEGNNLVAKAEWWGRVRNVSELGGVGNARSDCENWAVGSARSGSQHEGVGRVISGGKQWDVESARSGSEPMGIGNVGSCSEHERVGRAISDAEAGWLAAAAKDAARLLEGRALLRGEAHDLLEGASLPGAAGSWSGVLQLAALLGRVRLRGSVAADSGRPEAMKRRRRERSCLRCGSGEALMLRTACAACGRDCAYCTACIAMGRSRECELLIIGKRNFIDRGYTDIGRFSGGNIGSSGYDGSCKGSVGSRSNESNRSGIDDGNDNNNHTSGQALLDLNQRLAYWNLSPAQTAAAAKALRFVEERPDGVASGASSVSNRAELSSNEVKPIRNFLLWAVTGAGKTEMIFPLVESVLLRGGKALIATPRRDVVIELDPRIRKAFPKATVVTLYGGSVQRWESGDITLSTTHQLLRFYEGFDLVIVDEIDAFPFHGDKILQYAADKSCMPGAARLLLSATPPSNLQRAAKRGKLPHARVPVRFHRHPLPVPKLVTTTAVKQMLLSGKLPKQLISAMQQSLVRNAQLFVFVQRIAQTEPMAALLRKVLKHSAIAATSSQDPDRAEKVQHFRSCQIRVLVTTTILERGVTIPRSDVYILDADGRLFDEASLVQMAGRAGRSADDPFGSVYFCSRERNRSQVAAVRHIQAMNRIARKQGFLHPKRKKGRATP